ncbi:hypothetical protein [Deefgea sp. CFH1-16]|uniref:hypothetical protein n=1 Tax=Deefgea sp. CFH1-16 TaxID=2675457 RepID=UPI0027DD31A6|nr:hypothetical protein [Deefgea sp. CFH1-16]
MQKIKVWDPVVRVLHWSLAIAVLGNFLNEEGDLIHRWEGYAARSASSSAALFGALLAANMRALAAGSPRRLR